MKPSKLFLSSSRGRSIVAFAVASFVSFSTGYALDYTWTTPGGGTWNNAAANWSTGGGAVPFVSIAQGATIAKDITAFVIGASTITVNNTTGLAIGMEFGSSQFPIGTTITGISGNELTLSNASTAASGAQGGVQFQTIGTHNAIFGSAGIAAGSVNLTSNQNVRKLTLSAGVTGDYTFSGSALTIGGLRDGGIIVNNSATFNNAVSIGSGGASISFNTAGQSLTFTGGGNIISNNVVGSNVSIRESSSMFVESGTYSGGGAAWNIGNFATRSNGVLITGEDTVVSTGSIQVGNSGSGVATISGGATVSTGSQASIGRNNNSGALIVDGGIFQANTLDGVQTIVHVGREGNGNGLLQVKNGGRVEVIGSGVFNNEALATDNGGGIMGLNSSNTSAGSTTTGTLDIQGGTVVVKDLRLNTGNRFNETRSTAGKAVVNLSGTGSLYIGGTVNDAPAGTTNNFNAQGGISNRGIGTSTYEINLSGGTLGANADWAANVNMTLVSGNTTFKAANESGEAGFDIDFNGTLTGGGGLTVTGGDAGVTSGTISLNAANSYTGGTTINQGRLDATVVGSLGLGNVSVSNFDTSLLTLSALNAISQTASLYFGGDSTIDLDYTGTQLLTGVFQTDDGNQTLTGGLYTADQLNNFFGVDSFTGTGLIQVAIPEPSSTALLGLGLGSMVFFRKRRNA